MSAQGNYAHFLSDYTTFRKAKKVYREKAMVLREFLHPLFEQYCIAHNTWTREWADSTRLSKSKAYISPPNEFRMPRLDHRDWVFDDDGHGDDFETGDAVYFKPSYRRSDMDEDDQFGVPIEYFRNPAGWLAAKQERFDAALVEYRQKVRDDEESRARELYESLKARFEPEQS